MIDKKTANQQQKELFGKIWKICDKLRGKVEPLVFKDYLFSFMFYYYISKNIVDYFNKVEHESLNGDPNFDYEKLDDNLISQEIIDNCVAEKGFFIYPSQLFSNVYKKYENNIEELNVGLFDVLTRIEKSAIGTDSEQHIKGLFIKTFDSNDLGQDIKTRNELLFSIMSEINSLSFDNFDENKIDVFGDTYEFLLGKYASVAGKSAGQFYTPQTISKLLVYLAIYNNPKVNTIYDPTCGSGSLLLSAGKILCNSKINYYGQENIYSTFCLSRMNMFLHNINYSNFDIRCGDTLVEPKHGLDQKYDVIISNPPYSIEWTGSSDPTLINDERFAVAGVLAPKNNADFAFILHMLYLLKTTGKAAIVCFPGIMYRGKAEQKIRKYLIENNYIDTIIGLHDSLFYGTTTSVYIMVLSKSKQDKNILFINAEDIFTKDGTSLFLSDENIDSIIKLYKNRSDVDKLSKLVSNNDVLNNCSNLSIGQYIEEKDNNEILDIESINKELDNISKRNIELRNEINKIIKEIDNE